MCTCACACMCVCVFVCLRACMCACGRAGPCVRVCDLVECLQEVFQGGGAQQRQDMAFPAAQQPRWVRPLRWRERARARERERERGEREPRGHHGRPSSLDGCAPCVCVFVRACVPRGHHRQINILDAPVALLALPLASGNAPIRPCHHWHALTHFDAGTCITRTHTHFASCSASIARSS
jgi:hypothetical protein